MAYMRNDYCHECRQKTQHTNGQCNDCRARKRRERDAKWEALSVEEKLRDIDRRLKRVEMGPPRY